MDQGSSREAGAAAQVELQQLPVLRQGPGTRTTETRDRDLLGEPSGEPVRAASIQLLLQTRNLHRPGACPQWDSLRDDGASAGQHVHQHLREDGIRQLQTFQAQVLQEPAATDDALQSSWRDGGVGQVHLDQLQTAEDKRQKDTSRWLSIALDSTFRSGQGKRSQEWWRKEALEVRGSSGT